MLVSWPSKDEVTTRIVEALEACSFRACEVSESPGRWLLYNAVNELYHSKMDECDHTDEAEGVKCEPQQASLKPMQPKMLETAAEQRAKVAMQHGLSSGRNNSWRHSTQGLGSASALSARGPNLGPHSIGRPK